MAEAQKPSKLCLEVRVQKCSSGRHLALPAAAPWCWSQTAFLEDIVQNMTKRRNIRLPIL